MLLTTLRTVGGSVMFAIPRQILDGLGLSPDTQVGLSVADGRLIVDPHPKPRYRLADLMAQCDLSAPPSEESRTWLDASSDLGLSAEKKAPPVAEPSSTLVPVRAGPDELQFLLAFDLNECCVDRSWEARIVKLD